MERPAAPRRSKQASASFFDSGYFLLAALESGDEQPIGVNVDHGGQGARIVVVPRYPASDPRTQALYERLRAVSDTLGTTLKAESAVGGPAATLLDYQAVASKRLPLIVIILTLITALLLGLLLRSIVVPIIGVVLNLLAVGATLGLLALLFQGDAPLLGGPGVIDAVAVTAIFGVVFALSIDYQVFILSRIREEWQRCGDEERALHVGMSRTARVVTGAALSMLGVFIAFALRRRRQPAPVRRRPRDRDRHRRDARAARDAAGRAVLRRRVDMVLGLRRRARPGSRPSSGARPPAGARPPSAAPRLRDTGAGVRRRRELGARRRERRTSSAVSWYSPAMRRVSRTPMWLPLCMTYACLEARARACAGSA